MFRLGADLQVYLHREPIDFRAGINSLAVLVQETMALDPFAPAVFAFCNKRRDRMKLVAEQLHIEVKAKVLQNVRFKYACRHCERTGITTPVVIAPMPAQPLPGSIATASTLAFALVHKYVDGTPLYRLAQVFERAGVPVSRGALGHWVIGSSEKHLSRIYDALKLRLRSQPLIHGDETTVQVLKEKDREATSTSYMWAYRSGADSDEPIVLFDYQPGRGQIHPQAFLGDYRGIVMSDGYSAWRTLEGATHIGCMAHSRRRFVDALKARKKGGGPPEQALKFFEQLYRIEGPARDEKPGKGETPDECIRRFRRQHSIPVLNALKQWLDKIAPKVLPDSKLGDAVSYTRNQWEYLTRYAQDGHMPIDNNLLERDIRIFATGRKSWLFSDTVDGAKASAVVYSLMLTCRASRVEPLAWLRHVLTELPQRSEDVDIDDLLPFNACRQAAALMKLSCRQEPSSLICKSSRQRLCLAPLAVLLSISILRFDDRHRKNIGQNPEFGFVRELKQLPKKLNNIR